MRRSGVVEEVAMGLLKVLKGIGHEMWLYAGFRFTACGFLVAFLALYLPAMVSVVPFSISFVIASLAVPVLGMMMALIMIKHARFVPLLVFMVVLGSFLAALWCRMYVHNVGTIAQLPL